MKNLYFAFNPAIFSLTSSLLFFLIIKWWLSYCFLSKMDNGFHAFIVHKMLVFSSNFLGDKIFHKLKVSEILWKLCVLSKMIWPLGTRLSLCKKKTAWQPIFIFRSDNVWKEKQNLTVDCWFFFSSLCNSYYIIMYW